jgi:hypothetical protein
LCSNLDFGDKQIIFRSENGVIGYGPFAALRHPGHRARRRQSGRHQFRLVRDTEGGHGAARNRARRNGREG